MKNIKGHSIHHSALLIILILCKMNVLVLYNTAFNSIVRKLDVEPTTIILTSVGSTVVIYKLWLAYNGCTEGVVKSAKKHFFKILRHRR